MGATTTIIGAAVRKKALKSEGRCALLKIFRSYRLVLQWRMCIPKQLKEQCLTPALTSQISGEADLNAHKSGVQCQVKYLGLKLIMSIPTTVRRLILLYQWL